MVSTCGEGAVVSTCGEGVWYLCGEGAVVSTCGEGVWYLCGCQAKEYLGDSLEEEGRQLEKWLFFIFCIRKAPDLAAFPLCRC